MDPLRRRRVRRSRPADLVGQGIFAAWDYRAIAWSEDVEIDPAPMTSTWLTGKTVRKLIDGERRG